MKYDCRCGTKDKPCQKCIEEDMADERENAREAAEEFDEVAALRDIVLSQTLILTGATLLLKDAANKLDLEKHEEWFSVFELFMNRIRVLKDKLHSVAEAGIADAERKELRRIAESN